MTTVQIGDKLVGEGHPCFVVAEIGINHNGSLQIAKKMIDVAVEAGCHAVKFQKRTVPVIYTAEELAKDRPVDVEVVSNAVQRGVLSADAVKRLTDSDFKDTTNGDLKWALELTEEEYKEIDIYCSKKGIMWFASPWDEESVDFLERFNPVAYKIASASLTDDELLQYIRSKNHPVIISTGMSTMAEVEHAVELLGTKDLILLHTVSTYPANDEDLNLSVIQTLRDLFPGVVVGYSGHERGIATSVCAIALGAHMMERHMTLEYSMFGSDQAASLQPKGLALLVRDIRACEAAFGSGMKEVLPAEVPIKEKLRRKG